MFYSTVSYDDLRAEAALHAQMRAEAFQKASHAWRKKQGELAAFYAQQVCLLPLPIPVFHDPFPIPQGHMHTERMNEANERAAKCILQYQ